MDSTKQTWRGRKRIEGVKLGKWDLDLEAEGVSVTRIHSKQM